MMQQEKLVSIGRLSAGVAHEINNPLTTILTSSMLLQEDLEEEADMYKELDIISNEALRCRKIVKSLLDFARQSKSVIKLGDLNVVIKESMVLTRKQAKFKDIILGYSLSENLPKLKMDRDKIQQTIINLTLNAIEATPSGGEIRLSSKYRNDKKVVEIEVSDTGEGIEPENMNKIFDPFFTTKKAAPALAFRSPMELLSSTAGPYMSKALEGREPPFVLHFR